MKIFFLKNGDYVAALGVAVVLFIGAWFGVRPLYVLLKADRITIQEEYIASNTRLQRAFAQDSTIEDIVYIKQNMQDTMITPIKKDVVEIIQDIEGRGESIGVTVQFAAIEASTFRGMLQKKKLAQVDASTDNERYFSINARGTFAEVMTFLGALENYRYTIILDQVSIVPVDPQQEIMKRSGVSLRQPTPAQLGSVAPSLQKGKEGSDREETGSVVATILAHVPIRQQ